MGVFAAGVLEHRETGRRCHTSSRGSPETARSIPADITRPDFSENAPPGPRSTYLLRPTERPPQSFRAAATMGKVLSKIAVGATLLSSRAFSAAEIKVDTSDYHGIDMTTMFSPPDADEMAPGADGRRDQGQGQSETMAPAPEPTGAPTYEWQTLPLCGPEAGNGEKCGKVVNGLTDWFASGGKVDCKIECGMKKQTCKNGTCQDN